MSASSETVEELVHKAYPHGFVTEIDAATGPPPLRPALCLAAAPQALQRRRAQQAPRGDPAGSDNKYGGTDHRNEGQGIIDRHLELEHPPGHDLPDDERADAGDQPRAGADGRQLDAQGPPQLRLGRAQGAQHGQLVAPLHGRRSQAL